MQFPDLSALPAWAQVIVYVTFGVSLAFIIAVARFGHMLGKKAPYRASSAVATVAAVIVDPAELQKLTAAAITLDATLASMNKTGQSLARASTAGARESREFSETLKELTNAVDRLREEIIRRPSQ